MRRHHDVQWSKRNGSLQLLSSGGAYMLPDYVDCPAAGRLSRVAAKKHALDRVPSAPLRPFHSLPPSALNAACHMPDASAHTRKALPRVTRPRRPAPSNTVCVIMRFYAGQLGDATRFSVDTALQSLTQQHHKDVSILLVHTDASNVTAVHTVLRQINDPRIRLVTFGDLARDSPVRVDHKLVWLATEKAITMCPETARWLLVTNGDNTYDPAFLDHLDDRYDLVAYDFYTRHRPAWARGECDAYGMRDGVAQGCLPNHLRLCQTDIGAIVLNLPRWRYEQRRFSEHESYNGSEDGLALEALVDGGWRHKRVTGASTGGCLVDHNPNYHSCLRLSNTTVWDDRAQQCVDTRDDVDALRVATRRHGPVERCLM